MLENVALAHNRIALGNIRVINETAIAFNNYFNKILIIIINVVIYRWYTITYSYKKINVSTTNKVFQQIINEINIP